MINAELAAENKLAYKPQKSGVRSTRQVMGQELTGMREVLRSLSYFFA